VYSRPCKFLNERSAGIHIKHNRRENTLPANELIVDSRVTAPVNSRHKLADRSQSSRNAAAAAAAEVCTLKASAVTVKCSRDQYSKG
jgi:hypothetical protein